MRKIKLLFFLLLVSNLTFGQSKADEDSIKAIVESAYVGGIHNGGSIEEIRKGFHPTFKMLRLENNDVISVSLDEWITAIEKGRKQNADKPIVKAESEYLNVIVSGNTASVVMNISKNKKKIFADHLILYKFLEGWRIVSKAFYRIP